MSDSLQTSLSGSSLSSLSSSTSSNDLSAMQQVMKGAPVLTKSYSTKQVDIMSQAKDHPVVVDFRQRVQANPDMAMAVCGIQALTSVVRRSSATTMMGLEIELKDAIDLLKACYPSSISLAAGCELFSRYVTRASLDIPQFAECVQRLLERGEQFTSMSLNSRNHIAVLMSRFISDGKAILIHGYSRVVSHTLIHAAKEKKNFRVFLTEGRPNCDGFRAAEELSQYGIDCTLVLDSAVGYIMEKIDLVLMGAEGIVESGGIINKIGTLPIAITAKMYKKPFYVAAECYKFARLFPLNQSDLPETKESQPAFRHALPDTEAITKKLQNQSESKSNEKDSSSSSSSGSNTHFEILNPSCDYTPPEYITLLFTDLGILTPSAVSDELIKLYY